MSRPPGVSLPSLLPRYLIIVPGSPVSKNRIHCVKGRRIALTEEAKVYLDEVGWRAREARVPLITDRFIDLSIWYFHKTPVRRQDSTNPTMLIHDALEGILYLSDAQVRNAYFYPRWDKANPRVEIVADVTDAVYPPK